jgi:hypothetical protein
MSEKRLLIVVKEKKYVILQSAKVLYNQITYVKYLLTLYKQIKLPANSQTSANAEEAMQQHHCLVHDNSRVLHSPIKMTPLLKRLRFPLNLEHLNHKKYIRQLSY